MTRDEMLAEMRVMAAAIRVTGEREMRRQRAALLWEELEAEERRRAGRGRAAAERRSWWRVASRMGEWCEV